MSVLNRGQSDAVRRTRTVVQLVTASCLWLAAVSCQALEPKELHTDRDAFTPSTFTVEPGQV
ncbi:MAG: hypothetical protein EBS83_07070, partial [Planctomycetia bacterium]|nr:hypothetical protein [Planctomycetia bacterium]